MCTFVKGAAAAASGSFTFGPGLFDGGRASAQSLQADGSVQGARPNILVIKVDQLRFPSVFPPGINSAGDFLKAVHAEPLPALAERGEVCEPLHRRVRLHARARHHHQRPVFCSRAGWSRPSPPRPASRSRRSPG